MPTKKDDALSTVTEVSIAEFNPSNLSEVAGMFDVNDNIKGVKGRLPQIGISHSAQMFKYQDTKLEKFKGIIIHHSPANAWWEKSFEQTGGGVPPSCASSNAEKPNSGDSKQCETCFDCPLNKFGSGKADKDGKPRGKACKNLWRLHILIEGQAIPKRLTLPPSNIGALQDFLIYLRDIGVPHELAVLEFSLKPEKNKDGIEYALLNLKPLTVITDKAKAMELKKVKTDFQYAFSEAIDIDEIQDQGVKVDIEPGTKL